jgi:hypothetical protein
MTIEFSGERAGHPPQAAVCVKAVPSLRDSSHSLMLTQD